MDSDFERLLADGVYKQSPEFIEDEANLQRVITYLQEVKPRPEVFDILLGLLKFFRFPLALCCQHLYRRLKSNSTQLQACQEKVREVAAYVRSLTGEIGVGSLPEIQFFQQWGHLKKKFKVNISEHEKEFGRCIMAMSSTKQQLKDSHLNEDVQRMAEELMGTSFENANIFEEKSIQLMKASASEIVESALQRKQEEKQPRRHRDTRQDEERAPVSVPIQKRETVVEKSRRSESIPVHHEPAVSQVVAVPVWEGEKGVCCRTSFVKDQVVDQPESLRIEYKYYRFPFKSRPGEVPSKCDKIKRTLCGFLNAEGGTIYFGIKQLTENRKRYINGLFLSESAKKDFGMEITRLMKEILPDVGKKCTVKYVPVKDKQDKYISGLYIVKVIVQQGAKDQVYSYLQAAPGGTVERFAFKTQNEVLQISEIQRVLKIFKNKVQLPAKDYYPAHPHPCPEPQVGKPLYKLNDDYEDEYEDDYDDYVDRRDQRNNRGDKYDYSRVEKYDGRGDKYDYRSEKTEYREKNSYQYERFDRDKYNEDEYNNRDKDFPSILKERREDEAQNWHQEQQNRRNVNNKVKAFKQKATDCFLLQMRLPNLQILLERQNVQYKLITQITDQNAWTFLQLNDFNDKGKLIFFSGVMKEVYSRVSFESLTEEQLNIMDSIIQEYRHKWGNIKKQTGKTISFNTEQNAAAFYLKLHEMGLNVDFTPIA